MRRLYRKILSKLTHKNGSFYLSEKSKVRGKIFPTFRDAATSTQLCERTVRNMLVVLLAAAATTAAHVRVDGEKAEQVTSIKIRKGAGRCKSCLQRRMYCMRDFGKHSVDADVLRQFLRLNCE